MAKQTNLKKYKLQEPKPLANIAAEPMVLYAPASLKKIPLVAEFTYKRFQKNADKIPFTQKEWASILHLSERTIQRYAKANTAFEGIYVDKILHIEQLINIGLQAFTDSATLYRWLKREKPVMGKSLNFDSLQSSAGIQETIYEIGRILYGVYI